MARGIFLALAALSLVAGLALLWVPFNVMVVAPARVARDNEAARRIPVVRQLADLAALPVGTKVVLEGHISPDNPTTTFVFVAEYSHERTTHHLATYEVLSHDAERGAYGVSKRVTPPLRFNLLVEGSVPIVNDDYVMISNWGWSMTDGPDNVRGLEPGRPAAVLGWIVAQGDGSPGVRANTVTNNPVDYLTSVRVDPDSRGWAQAFSMVVGCGGVLLLLGSLFFVALARAAIKTTA